MVSSMGEDSFKKHLKLKLGAEKSQSAAHLDPHSTGMGDAATTAVNTGGSWGLQNIGTRKSVLSKLHKTTRQIQL